MLYEGGGGGDIIMLEKGNRLLEKYEKSLECLHFIVFVKPRVLHSVNIHTYSPYKIVLQN